MKRPLDEDAQLWIQAIKYDVSREAVTRMRRRYLIHVNAMSCS